MPFASVQALSCLQQRATPAHPSRLAPRHPVARRPASGLHALDARPAGAQAPPTRLAPAPADTRRSDHRAVHRSSEISPGHPICPRRANHKIKIDLVCPRGANRKIRSASLPAHLYVTYLPFAPGTRLRVFPAVPTPYSAYGKCPRKWPATRTLPARYGSPPCSWSPCAA